jgi:raffinose/stachyose/melibiose transport system substrate-binding protein
MKRTISLILSTAAVLAVLSIAVQTPKAVAAQSGPTCGTQPVKLNAYFETGFDIPFKLSEEFTKQYPNVTWDIKQDQFANLINATPRLLSSDNPPDLIRLPTMVSFAQEAAQEP